MSVVNVFVSSQRVAMLTDESLYSADATIVGFVQKAFPVQSWNGAVSGRGDALSIAAASVLAERYDSFDAFVARSGPEFERLHREGLATAGAGQTIIEVHVVGWSEREDRAQGYVLRSFADDDAPAFVWRSHDDEDGCFYHQISRLEDWRLHRQGAEPHVDFTAETFDPVRHGVPLIEAQRRTPSNPKYGIEAAGKYIVGGALWLTIVDRDGTRQGILHEWPDAVGEPIQPAPFDDAAWPKILPFPMGTAWTYDRFMRAFQGGAVDPETMALDKARLAVIEVAAPPVTAGMTRQQRRAAEAAARKQRKGHAHAA